LSPLIEIDFLSPDPFVPRKSKKEGKKKEREMSIGWVNEGEEVIAFCFGEGGGWSEMTLLALMKSGEIYAICPYLPQQS
jgi:nucleoporin NUP82